MAGPVLRFRSGAVTASVYEKQRKDGSAHWVIKFSRSCRDLKTQRWKETSSFSVADLPTLALLARRAFESLGLNKEDPCN